jgi:hypothetical protein
VLYPIVLSVVVIATANHYLVDVIAGLAVVGVGAVIAHIFTLFTKQMWPDHVPGAIASAVESNTAPARNAPTTTA